MATEATKTTRKAAAAPTAKAEKAPSLKSQREELLTHLYAELEEVESWTGSAKFRYNAKRIDLERIIMDMHGAASRAHCSLRDARAKWPQMFVKGGVYSSEDIARNGKAVADTLAELNQMLFKGKAVTAEDMDGVHSAVNSLRITANSLEAMTNVYSKTPDRGAAFWNEFRAAVKAK